MTNNTDNVKIAKLEVQMTNNTSALDRVETKVDALIVKIDAINVVQIEIQGLKDKIVEMEKIIATNNQRDALTKWVYPSLSAGAGAVLAVLVNIALHKS